MKVAYFVDHYPKVSHSFIRREINALERQDIEIDRYALRTRASELVDKRDKNELEKTRYLLNQPLRVFFHAIFLQLLRNPVRFSKSLATAIRIGWNSDRGLARHFFYFFEACLLERWLKQSRVSRIHAHFGNNSAAVVMLSRLLGGPPCSFTVHGPIEFDKPEFFSLGEKINHADFVVAISSFGKSQLFRWTPYEQWHKVKIVHCGLEKAFYDIDYPLVRQNRRLVCVGRLCEQKGQLLLVEAAIELSKEKKDFQIVLVGDGPMRGEIEALIERYQMDSRILITGWVSSERVREELLDSTALVLPSFAEGLPVVIMEAMALGRPVATTYIAGIPELVIPEENGWLMPAGSLESLVATMRKILDYSDEQLLTLGSHARQRVVERHNIDTEAGKLARLFAVEKL